MGTIQEFTPNVDTTTRKLTDKVQREDVSRARNQSHANTRKSVEEHSLAPECRIESPEVIYWRGIPRGSGRVIRKRTWRNH